jgi:hypothetical protein
MRKKILRAAIAVVMGIISVGSDLAPRAAAADIPATGCKESPALVGQCFAVHGRLSWRANGRPYLRPAGTSRLLGFPREVEGLRRWLPDSVDPQAPGNIYERASPRSADEVEVTGDFLVCPLTPEKPRAMRMVCMESAGNLTLLPKTTAPSEK